MPLGKNAEYPMYNNFRFNTPRAGKMQIKRRSDRSRLISGLRVFYTLRVTTSTIASAKLIRIQDTLITLFLIKKEEHLTENAYVR
jgi:hypothetical protein